MANPSQLAINQITNDPVETIELVNLYSRLDVPSIAPWRSKFEEHGVSPQSFRRLVEELGISVNGVCFCGSYGSRGKEGRQAQIDDNKRTIDFAAEIGAPSVTTLAGGLLAGSKDLDYSRKFNMSALAEVLEYAKQVGVVLGLEPLHPMYTPDWSVVTGIRDANDWCDQLGEGIGIIVDVYHTWWDHELESEIQRAGRENRIVAAHVSDWLVPTKDLLLDRGLMGDGVIDIPKIRQWLESAGYAGRYEVEIFSTDLWQTDQAAYIEQIKDRFVNFV
jgi:sugar phosphate isomerase/epimerase